MSKTAVVMRREFMETVRSKTFIIMTLIGPLLIAGFIALEVFILTRGGGGAYSMAIIDQSPEGVGRSVEAALKDARGFMGKSVTFNITRYDNPADIGALRKTLDDQVNTKALGGYLIVPPKVLDADTAKYFGKNATNGDLTEVLRNTVQQVVQTTRLGDQGIDAGKVTASLRPVPFKSEKTSGGGLKGSAAAARVMAFLMGFAIYLVIALYGASIMNGVLEEKRDKIVEVIVSSLPAPKLVIGKVLGIGGAGFLQMLIWAASVGVALTYAGAIAGLFTTPEKAEMVKTLVKALPHVPLSVGAIFLLFFMGGFLIYSAIYASIGAVATTNQEAQQMVFPAIMPLVIGFLMANSAMTNADSSMAKWGSFIPFTSPLVMPIRAVLGSASLVEAAASLLLVVATAFLMLWAAGKVYRVGIFATGKKPTMKEVIRWVRAS